MGEAVGRHWAYYIVSLAITVVLALAANTSFGGLPVLASLLARDHALPHLFSLRGDRQTFSNGIWVLAVLSGALLVAVKGDTQRLIPLFAIGVFTGFTLSQTGLVVHWWRTRPAGWRRRATINAVGALATGVSTIIFLLTKFVEGGWVVVVAVPLFMLLFRRITRYYATVAANLGFGVTPERPQAKPTLVIVPITTVSRLAAHALSEALSIGDEVLAVTVVIGDEHEEQAAACQAEWAAWDPGVPLRVLRTEYASAVEPIVALIDEEHGRTRRADRRPHSRRGAHPRPLPLAAQPHRRRFVRGPAHPDRRRRGAGADGARPGRRRPRRGPQPWRRRPRHQRPGADDHAGGTTRSDTTRSRRQGQRRRVAASMVRAPRPERSVLAAMFTDRCPARVADL